MNVSKSEINELIRETEKKLGKKLYTTCDFDDFARVLNQTGKSNLSSSTLKRLWGYVPYDHQPRMNSLNVLAQYNGYTDFLQFCNQLGGDDSDNNSVFLFSDQILSTDLLPNQLMEVTWAPNRYLLLRHITGTRFVVETAENSKLMKGDCFDVAFFELGQPLSLPCVMRGDKKLPSFIAGKNGGLTLINLPDDVE